MSLKLMYITNKPEIAKIVETRGVDRIFVDLEEYGKEQRQGHLDTVISHHKITDVKEVKQMLKTSKLLVRINPIYIGSQQEIDRVIQDGADIVMLPFFKSRSEVETFINIVNSRVKTCLLLETPEAVEIIEDILTIDGIDEIHIGLNDLHLGYQMRFMFELLCDGTVEKLCNKFRAKGIQYGFGGIACIGKGLIPAENIIIEHYRLGSNMVILSRSFCNQDMISDLEEFERIFTEGMEKIRSLETEIQERLYYFIANKIDIENKVIRIISA